MTNLRDFAKADGTTVNNAGGQAYKLSERDRFIRALTLGTESGTFYVSEKELTRQTSDFIVSYIKDHGVEAVQDLVEISTQGRAQRNTAAIFALAVALNSNDTATKKAAEEAVTKVCRTFFHLSELVADLKAIGAGWGRAKARAIAGWYELKNSNELGYQVVKYRQRGGYTHRDVLRLAHPRLKDANLTQFVLGLGGKANAQYDVNALPQTVQNYIKLSGFKSAEAAAMFINETHSRVAWEFLDTSLLNSPEVWAALIKGNHVGYTAMLRNLNRFVKIGLFDFDGGSLTFDIAGKLSDVESIKRELVHPISVISAVRANETTNYYGRIGNSSLPQAVAAALNKAVELSFKNIDPTGKTFYLGVDVSASMSWTRDGRGGVMPRDYAATLAAIIAKNEKRSFIRGFSTNLVDLPITASDNFSSVVAKMSNIPFGATNPSAIIRDAISRKLKVDEFVIITDNEVNRGENVAKLLNEYRAKFNPSARLVVIATEGTEFTIGDPMDKWTLNLSGADSAVVSMAVDFARD